MCKPTVEEYEKALREKKYCKTGLALLFQKQDEFLDMLLNIREDIKSCKESLDKANEIVQKYETYQEAEREMRGE